MSSSCVRVRFGFSRFMMGVSSDMISCCSSLVKRLEMTPVCGGGGDRTTERGRREIELEREKETDTEQKVKIEKRP
jgi:hypothetical protein